MNARLALAIASAACASGLLLPCAAQTSAPAGQSKSALPALSTANAETAEPRDRSEPNVKETIIEDNGSKIDQLTVRGHVQHVIVTPKVGLTKPYEILIAPEGRTPYYGTGGAGSAAGNRVWNVLKF